MLIFSHLPGAYQQVEYIENTSQSYIDTNFILNQNSKIEMTIYTTNLSQGHLFGSRESATSKNLTISDGHLDYGTYTTNRINFSTYVNDLITKITIDKNNLSIINNSYNQNFQLSSVNDFTCIDSAYIFNVSGNPYGDYRVWGKLYECKIWDNGNLVRNFIPCYRKSDNEIGLYDIVNNVFYTNEGTGSFTKGDNVDLVDIVINNKNIIKIEDINGNIWWQKTKQNIYDPTTAPVLNAYFENGVANITANANNKTTYVACQPNTTYTIKKLQTKVCWIGYTKVTPDIGVTTYNRLRTGNSAYDGTTYSTNSYTTGSDAAYIVIRYIQTQIDTGATEEGIRNSIEIIPE